MNNAGHTFKILGLFLIIIFSGLESRSQTKSKATYKSSSETHSHKSSNGVSSTDLEYRGKIVFTDDQKKKALFNALAGSKLKDVASLRDLAKSTPTP